MSFSPLEYVAITVKLMTQDAFRICLICTVY